MRMLPDLAIPRFDPAQAVALGPAAQEPRIEPGIEVVGVAGLRLGLQRKRSPREAMLSRQKSPRSEGMPRRRLSSQK